MTKNIGIYTIERYLSSSGKWDRIMSMFPAAWSIWKCNLSDDFISLPKVANYVEDMDAAVKGFVKIISTSEGRSVDDVLKDLQSQRNAIELISTRKATEKEIKHANGLAHD